MFLDPSKNTKRKRHRQEKEVEWLLIINHDTAHEFKSLDQRMVIITFGQDDLIQPKRKDSFRLRDVNSVSSTKAMWT